VEERRLQPSPAVYGELDLGYRFGRPIANIDLVTAWARQQVVERFGQSGYELHFTEIT
jgi:hypothetical protein